MRQLKAEYYKMKYSKASRWIFLFMVLVFFIPFVVGNDTLFMTFGDYRKLNSIGWICYIDDMAHVKAVEITRFALSVNFFTWIGFVVYVTTMVATEFQQGTIRASVVYGVNRTRLFMCKLFVVNSYFFLLYFIVEAALGLGLAWRYGFHYQIHDFTALLAMAALNAVAMLGLEAVAVVITILLKNTGLVTAIVCVYFFAGAITYPMVYENFQNRSLLIRVFCILNPTTYMYNICGYRMTDTLLTGTIFYGISACVLGTLVMHAVLKRQEL